MDTFSIKLLKIIFLLAKTTRCQIEKTHFDKMMDYIDKEKKKKKKNVPQRDYGTHPWTPCSDNIQISD